MNDTIRGLPNGDFEVLRPGGINHGNDDPYRAVSIFDWCEWSGGEMPVPCGAPIDVEYRNGTVRSLRAGDGGANGFYWRHTGNRGMGFEIVRYRLREPSVVSKSHADPVLKTPEHSHYFKDVSKLQTIDVYRTLSLFSVVDPCIQHAVKKLLVAGGRGGGKDISRDIQEAIDTLVRWQTMRAEEMAS